MPRTIGPYRIIDVLGEGGMGRVYKAEQTALGREVALKVLPPHIADRPGFRERFLREVRVLASINHPNVVTCFDAGEADGRVYMALELVLGGDAADLTKDKGGLHPRRALEIVRDAAAGLEALEKSGLIHRDIKPANLFLTTDGAAKLADLGLARQSDGGDSITDPGRPLGTPSYMSPEQATAADDVGIGTDIYALGATLFGLIAGRPPFIGDTPMGVIKQVVAEEAPRIRTLRPEIDERVEALIARCLKKRVEERFAHAVDLRQALDELVELARQGFPAADSKRPSSTTVQAATTRTPRSGQVALPEAAMLPSTDAATPSECVKILPDREPPTKVTPTSIEDFKRRLDPAKLARLIKRIHFSGDKMEAWMNLAPGASMPRALLEVVLEAANVKHGVSVPAVTSASRPSTQPRRLVLAIGDPPFPGVPGRNVADEEMPALSVPLVVKVDVDAMAAWGYLLPGQLVPREAAERVIKNSGIRFGIIAENITRLWEGPEIFGGRICLARGRAMAPTRPEGFQLVGDLIDGDPERGLTQVEAGTLLGEWAEEEAGVVGMDVFGQAIQPPAVERRRPDELAGEGTEVGRDRRGVLVLRSSRAGLVQRRADGEVRVVPAMEIQGDIGPDDPAIETDDLVVVHGHVLPGAKIASGSDVVVMGDLQDAVIEAGGTIEVQGDVVAGDGAVAAGDSIVVNGSVQRQIVAATLKITGTLDHCEVVATGDVEINKVVGGSVVAGGNLVANVAGDDLGATTELWAGHQPGMAEQNRIAELSEKRVAAERKRVLVDLRTQERELAALSKRQALVAGASYRNDDALKEFDERRKRSEERAKELDAASRDARAKLADQRRANRELKAVTDNADASLDIRVTAHRGVVARLANADPLTVRKKQDGLNLKIDDD